MITTSTAAPTRSRAPWLAAAGAAAAAGLDVAFDPAHRHVPLCPFHAVTGWDCPLCGGLRAVSAALRGQLAAAWQANALLWVALPMLLVGWLAWARTGRLPRLSPAATKLVVGAAVLYTVVRNLPFATGMRPT